VLGETTLPQSTKSKNSNFSVQIQINPQSHLKFVLRDTEESQFFDLVDCGDAVFSVGTGILVILVS